MTTRGGVARGAAIVLVVTVLAVAAGRWLRAAEPPGVVLEGASADRGRVALAEYGCRSCHAIPGVKEADSHAGPPLDRWSERVYVAGRLPNEPDDLVKWIMDPQDVVPGNAMPDLGVPAPTARDMAQYLYTLR